MGLKFYDYWIGCIIRSLGCGEGVKIDVLLGRRCFCMGGFDFSIRVF